MALTKERVQEVFPMMNKHFAFLDNGDDLFPNELTTTIIAEPLARILIPKLVVNGIPCKIMTQSELERLDEEPIEDFKEIVYNKTMNTFNNDYLPVDKSHGVIIACPIEGSTFWNILESMFSYTDLADEVYPSAWDKLLDAD